jgi:hypothetical protein
VKSKSLRHISVLALSTLALACQAPLNRTPTGVAGASGSVGTTDGGTAGSGAAGSGAGTSGTAGDIGTAGNGTAGNGTAGNGTAGNGSGAAGSGTAGSGTAGSGAGTSGNAGTGVAGGADGGTVTVANVFGIKNKFGESLADSFILWPCYANQNVFCRTIPPGQSCPTPHPDGTGTDYEKWGLVKEETFQLGGTPGQMYLATIQVNGISEAKYYVGGTRAAGEQDPPNAQGASGTDTWYTGGYPVYAEFFNVYSIRVFDTGMPPKMLQHYYLNSFPKTGNVQYETPWTFPISYMHSFPVMGGGTIVYHASDINCLAIDNCGPAVTTQTCPLNQGRNVPNEPGLVLPTMYQGTPTAAMNYRTGNNQPWHADVIHIRFVGVMPCATATCL